MMKSFIWAAIFLIIIATGAFLADAYPLFAYVIGFVAGDMSLIAGIKSIEELKQYEIMA